MTAKRYGKSAAAGTSAPAKAARTRVVWATPYLPTDTPQPWTDDILAPRHRVRSVPMTPLSARLSEHRTGD
jgi:hypothetical protein